MNELTMSEMETVVGGGWAKTTYRTARWGFFGGSMAGGAAGILAMPVLPAIAAGAIVIGGLVLAYNVAQHYGN